MGVLKAAVADGLCHPAVGRFLSFAFSGRIPSLRFRGFRLDTRAPSVTPEIVAMIFWGIYESAEVRFVKRYLRSDLDVVELGSSLGAVSCHIALRQHAGRRLVCVEANVNLVPVLQRNVSANAAQSVDVVNRAIGYDGPTVRLELGSDNTTSRVMTAGAHDEAEEVPASTLSEILEEFGVCGDYALVSDIEGAEAGFIDQDPAALSRCRQMVIELHEIEDARGRVTIDDLAETLIKRHGFQLVDRHGAVCVFERPAGS
jgi:FkbM family methyltransferase